MGTTTAPRIATALQIEPLSDRVDLAVGDRVLHGTYGGTEVTLDGEAFLVLRESEVLAVITPVAPVDDSGGES